MLRSGRLVLQNVLMLSSVSLKVALGARFH